VSIIGGSLLAGDSLSANMAEHAIAASYNAATGCADSWRNRGADTLAHYQA
jgi:hypothetical protein